jgi:hypothetical protein
LNHEKQQLSARVTREEMSMETNFVQPSIPKVDGHYDHWSMLMENFLRSKEYWTLIEQEVPATA